MFKGFREFILRGNVIDLAVGIVIGAAFSKVIDAFVAAFLTPLITLITGGRTAEYEARDEVRLLTEIRDRLPSR